MKFRPLRAAAAVAITGLLIVQPGVHFGSPTTAHAFSYNSLNKIQKRILSGFAEYELNPQSAAQSDAQARNYSPRGSDSCAVNLGDNVKVNQNCLNISDPDLQGRGQAQNETSIAIDPNNTNHLVASFNDYRRGDGNCYGAYSLDKGRTWNDTTIPTGFTRGGPFGTPREYWQAGGDTSVAWDTKGNVYFSCQLFNRGSGVSPDPDQSSAFVVFRSTGNNGASWNFPGRYTTVYADKTGTSGVLEDKALLTVDNHAGSPFQDRIYVTWTEFAADGTAYIYETHSNDYGETFSPRVLVSVNSPLCTNNYGLTNPQGNCNENQFSQPFTGPDGALYVVYNNYNNPTGHPVGDGDAGGSGAGNDAGTTAPAVPADNRNQILLSKSVDGGNTFSPPVKVSDYYDLPDCATYQGGQDFGRACVPEKGPTANSVFRATNYASGAVNPTNPAQVVVTFGSYINQHSNEANGCVPTGINPATGNNLYTGVKTPGACNNDILVSVSNDAGATFTGTTTDPRVLTTVTQDAGQATTDQFWQWAAFTKDGKLAVSYYDRQYGADETTGYSDISLSGSKDLTTFGIKRVTSGSMPPPTQFSGQFYGDYSGLAAYDNAYPLWMDTRSPELFLCPGTATTGTPPALCAGTEPNGLAANDQDIFTAAEGVPTK